MKNYPPVLILAFLRREKTLELLSSIIDMGVSRVYISCDLGRNPQELALQAELLQAVKLIGTNSNIDISVRQPLTNCGLALSVIQGVDWFFENEDFGVVLEDDLCVNEDFFKFCDSNLQALNSTNDHWLISGNQPSNPPEYVKTAFLSRYPLIWGWATTSRKWKIIRQEILFGRSFRLSQLLHPNKFGYFLSGLIRSRRGYVDSWAIPLASRMYMLKASAILPPVNLVTNRGIDSSSTHSRETDSYINIPLVNLPAAECDYNKSSADFSVDRNIEKYIYRIQPYAFLSPLYSVLLDSVSNKVKQKPLSKKIGQSSGDVTCVG